MVELVESCSTFTPIVRSFHFNHALLLIHSCGHFTSIMRYSLSTRVVISLQSCGPPYPLMRSSAPVTSCFLKFLASWNSSSRWFETLVSPAWNNSFLRLKLLVSLLETRVSPIWNLCFPRMKLILCLHPRISLSLSVCFRSFFFSFQPPLSHERPLSACGNLFPKKWQYAHMLFLLSPCYHLYYHLIVTLNPLINNRLT